MCALEVEPEFPETESRVGYVQPTTSPAVSIITPAFNSADYIDETLRSALTQTFPDFELLVVDDGSTDETPSIVEEAAHIDPRVRLIRQDRGGVSAARNRGMAQARGEILALLDSDDVWAPSFLQEQIALLQAHPDFDIASANALNAGGPLDGQPLKPAGGAPHEITLIDMIRAENAVSIMTVFRHRVTDLTGGFDESLRRSEDYDFWLRAVQAGARVLFNPSPLGWYRRRSDSNSANERSQLAHVVTVLQRLRSSRLDYPGEVREIDRQIARFTTERILMDAKAALSSADYPEAARRFSELSDSADTVYGKTLAQLGRRFPRFVAWAWTAKTGFRMARQRTQRVVAGAAFRSRT